MTYYLETIANFLIAEGWTNVFYDYDNPSFPERIFLQNTGGTKEVGVPNLYRDFALYVRRNNRATARTDSEALFVLLENNHLSDDGILNISATTPPELYNFDAKTGNQSEFIIQYRCLVVDNSLNRIY